MQISDPSTSRLPQKPVTRRDLAGPPVQEFSQSAHPLVICFLWMLPTALLTGTVIGLDKFGHLIGDVLGGLGIKGGRTLDYLGVIIMVIVMFASIAGPGWILSISTIRGPRDRKDHGFHAFQFFFAQILLIPSFIAVFYLISRLFV